MNTGLIILGIVFGIIFLIFLRGFIRDSYRKSEFSDWQIDDWLVFYGHNPVQVKAWSVNTIIFYDKENSVIEIDWSLFKENRSAYWRRINKECKLAMKSEEDVVRVNLTKVSSQKAQSLSSHPLLNGKVVEQLSETECQVFLNLALEEQEYELAEAIKNRMINFR